MNELQKIAEDLGGDVRDDRDGPYIRVDTDDNTSKENFDNLMMDMDDVRSELIKYEVWDYWADHNTQIIEFRLKKNV